MTITNRLKNSGETIPYAAIYAVTPNFADLFQPELLAGDLKETLRDPSGVAVTRSFARKISDAKIF